MTIERSKICEQLEVQKKIRETADTVSLVFEIPQNLNSKFKYKAGQFVTLFLDLDGEEIRRSYSLASSPEYDEDFKVTIKLVPNGKASTYLTQTVQEGDSLWVTPPAGNFCLTEDVEDKKIAFYAAGSGITPIISLLKTAMKKWPSTKCALLYQNKNPETAIFRAEISNLQKEFGSRLAVENIYSQPSPGWGGLSGRITKGTLYNFLSLAQFADKQTLHYLCGPESFMQTIYSALIDLGVDSDNIHKESFTVSNIPAATEHKAKTEITTSDFEIHEDDILIGDRKKLGAPQTIEVTLEGQTHTLPYKKDATILETLLDAGLNPPYSCLDGACMACIAKVEDGLVYQNDMGILTDDNVDANECLTCQARAAAKKVKIHYETF